MIAAAACKSGTSAPVASVLKRGMTLSRAAAARAAADVARLAADEHRDFAGLHRLVEQLHDVFAFLEGAHELLQATGVGVLGELEQARLALDHDLALARAAVAQHKPKRHAQTWGTVPVA